MSLRVKLLSLISICFVAFAVFGLLSWNTLNTAKINGEWYKRIAQEKDLIADVLPPPEYIVEAYLVVYQMLEESDDARLQSLAKRSKELREEYDGRHKYWDETLADGALKRELIDRSYKPAMDFFNIRDGKVIPAVLSKDRESAREITRTALKSSYDEHRKAIDNVVKMSSEMLERDERSIKEIVDSRTILIIVLGLIVASIMLVCGFYMNHICSNIIGRIIRVVGDLSGAADQLVSASAQTSSASQSLAEGASEQAASIEETSSSLEEMSSMTKQNAENASMADVLMKDSREMVERANGSMKQLTTSMDDISKSSDETSKIIKTIDEIAFQTNLLALNAAVEAARAGEAGAGFAVVANEVRNLALRAAEAARNTSVLIEGTVKNIKEGTALVQRTGEAFSEVTKSTGKVAGLVSEIAAASSEQAQGIGQINKAVTEMDKVTQQNAANAEESASASEEMSAQAEQMKKITLELSSLIGGGGHNGSGEKQAADSGQPKTLLKNALSLAPFKGPRKAAGPSKGVRPENVIPLGDGDFKNF